MAEITRKRTGELLQVLFRILLAHPNGLPAAEALKQLRKQIPLTDYEQGYYPSGGQRFDKIVRFATIDVVKAGWMEKHKGNWIITPSGKDALSRYKDPEEFYRQAARLFREWRKGNKAAEEPVTVFKEGSASSAQITFEQAEEQAWAEIERYLRSMNPYEFQELIAALLKAMGYYVSWIAPPGKDGGIDILAWGDPLGTRPPRIKAQVKRVSTNVAIETLRSFMAVLGEGDVGLFISTSGFTKDAQDEARAQQNRKITLVDLEKFFDLWVEYYPKLEDAARRKFPLQPIYFLAPAD
ncbi:MAG: restriction endonuclease [Meiothermus sp.]